MCPLLCILSPCYLPAAEDGPGRDKHPVSSLLCHPASRCGAAKKPSCEMDGAGGAPKLAAGRGGAGAGNVNQMLGSVPWTPSSSRGWPGVTPCQCHLAREQLYPASEGCKGQEATTELGDTQRQAQAWEVGWRTQNTPCTSALRGSSVTQKCWCNLFLG